MYNEWFIIEILSIFSTVRISDITAEQIYCMNKIYSRFRAALTSEWFAFAAMMSTDFERTAEITEREITEAEKQVIPNFMIVLVDEINVRTKKGLDLKRTRGEGFGLK